MPRARTRPGRLVRFVCTDGGEGHPKASITTIRLTPSGGLEHVRSVLTNAHYNRDGIEVQRRKWREEEGHGALPDFDLRCPKCRRNPRLSAAKMKQLIEALHANFPARNAVVECDISAPACARFM